MDASLAYGLDADDRLAEIGLQQSDLWTALHEGLHYQASLTLRDTNAVKGLGTWNAINRGLADTLVPKGWTRVEPNNFALTVHPNGSLAIAVLASDKATGMREGPLPSNTYPLARIHRRRASGQCPEAARGCSCESGIMVLKQQSRPQNKEHPIDATTQPSRSHPNRV